MSISGNPYLTSSQKAWLGTLTPEGHFGRKYDGYQSLDHLFNMMGFNEHEKENVRSQLWSKGGKKHKSRKSKKYRRNRKRNKSRKY
jgi:hypothetical protein